MKTIIAIDPGKKGGFAIQYNSGITLRSMPATDGDVADAFRDVTGKFLFNRSFDEQCVVVIEKVGGFIGVRQPGSAMFKFGYGTGFLHGVAMALGLPIVEVRPQEWQKHFGFGTKGNLTPTEWKNKLKSEAQRRFPKLNITLQTADALLILEWYRETHGGGQ